MKRESAAALRQSMEMAKKLTGAGIGFVCVPYLNQEEMLDLVCQADDAMNKMVKLIEQEETK